MENIVKIPTAAQAREAVAQQANSACEKIWGDILYTLKTVIQNAIADCKNYAYLHESMKLGVSTRTVFEKLRPMLTGMGYKVELNKYNSIRISWEEDKSDESE